MPEALTFEQVLEKLYEQIGPHPRFLDAALMVTTWLNRGDGVAVYQNVDLGHPEAGSRQFASFGSEAAMLPGEPPERLPDIGDAINYHYWLEGSYRGAPGDLPDTPEAYARQAD